MREQPDKKFEILLREAGCSEKVVAHCRAVRDVALEYAQRNLLVSVELVHEGAMLHDIGRGISHTIQHAQRGADLVRSLGFSEEIARIIECHTGAGLTADECTCTQAVSPRVSYLRPLKRKLSLMPITLLKEGQG